MGGSRRTGVACVFTHPRESTMPDLEAFVDGERLGLIGAARSMEAGPRRSRLEARPFAVRIAALAHDLCGYVHLAAAEA